MNLSFLFAGTRHPSGQGSNGVLPRVPHHSVSHFLISAGLLLQYQSLYPSAPNGHRFKNGFGEPRPREIRIRLNGADTRTSSGTSFGKQRSRSVVDRFAFEIVVIGTVGTAKVVVSGERILAPPLVHQSASGQ